MRSPNATITEITADNNLNLLWGTAPLALQSWVTSQLTINYQPNIDFKWTGAQTGNISGQFVDEMYFDEGINTSYVLNTQTNKNELRLSAEVTTTDLNTKQDKFEFLSESVCDNVIQPSTNTLGWSTGGSSSYVNNTGEQRINIVSNV